jgi:hypothetical protein
LSSIHKPAARLAFQLVPAAIVTALGIALLGNLARAPEPAPAEPEVQTAIRTEAVFTATPRPQAEADAAKAARASTPRADKPKAAAAGAPALPPPRPAAIEPPPAEPAPLQQAEAPKAAPSGGNVLESGLRRVTDAMDRVTQWRPQFPGWFSKDDPPRPPAPIPERNFAGTSVM